MIDVKTANVKYMEGDLSGAAADYLRGAEEGDALCAFNYAYCLFHGRGVERDPAEARRFFVYAEEQVGEACYNLACMYISGVGVKKNYKKAYDYMHKAAENGVLEAQLFLGVAHVMGSIFEPDICFISMIPYHTPEHMREGMLLEGDISVEEFEADDEARVAAVRQDASAALEWFRESARHSGEYCEEMAAKGKYLYARCFIDGVGTDFDRDRGNALMRGAAASGSYEALDYLTTRAPYVLDGIKDKKFLSVIEEMKQHRELLGGDVGFDQ